MSLKKNISYAITLLVIIIFGVYLSLNFEDFRPLLHINTFFLVLILIGNLATIFANGLFIKFVIQPFGKHISTSESFYVSILSSVGNFFTSVGGGLSFRAIYLKKRHQLSYSKYLSTVSGNYIFVFFVTSLIGIVSLFMLRDHRNVQYFILLASFLFLFLCCLAISLLKLPKFSNRINHNKINSILEIIDQVSIGLKTIFHSKKLLVQLLALTLFNLSITLINNYLIIKSLDLSIGLPQLALFSVLGLLSLFINITPANLGIKEAVYIFSSSVVGFSVSEIIAISLIDRGVLFLSLLLVWLFSLRIKNKFDQI